MTVHPYLFEPLKLRHKTLRNRIVFGAHTANMAEDGLPGERHLGYYLERARGGAAMHLAELGHEVVIVTGAAMVGKSVQRTSADGTLRIRLKGQGVSWMTESALTDWRGEGGTVRNLLDGEETFIEADALVLACTNVAETTLLDDLAGGDLEVHSIGDCVSPRLAVAAIYEGRALGMRL